MRSTRCIAGRRACRGSSTSWRGACCCTVRSSGSRRSTARRVDAVVADLANDLPQHVPAAAQPAAGRCRRRCRARCADPEAAAAAARMPIVTDPALVARVAALEARLEEQDATLRRILTLMVDFVETDRGPHRARCAARHERSRHLSCRRRQRRRLDARVLNGMSVDVEEAFQVGAFENTIAKSSWDGLESRVVAEHARVPRSVRRNRYQGDLLHARLGGAAPSRADPADRRCGA